MWLLLNCKNSTYHAIVQVVTYSTVEFDHILTADTVGSSLSFMTCFAVKFMSLWQLLIDILPWYLVKKMPYLSYVFLKLLKLLFSLNIRCKHEDDPENAE